MAQRGTLAAEPLLSVMSSKLLDPDWLQGSMLGCGWLSQLPVCGLLLARVTGVWLRASSAVEEVCVQRAGGF